MSFVSIAYQVVTIDGPAASGKTSVSRELARRLGWSWVSTGAFYRGLAYVAFQEKIDLNNERKLSDLAIDSKWSVKMSQESTQVYWGDEDVTHFIFQEEIGNIASRISAFSAVRKALLIPQRNCLEKALTMSRGLVAEGRDCGTVVFPEAITKIYLTAREENRAERRAKDQGLSVESTAKAQAERDFQDSTRKVAPMSIPENSYLIDTSELNFHQVCDLVEAYARKTLKLE